LTSKEVLRDASPPCSALEDEIVFAIGVVATDAQDLRVHVLMAGAAQQQAIGRRPASATAAVPQMVHVIAATTLTGATPASIPAPDGRPDGSDRLGELLAALPLNDHGWFRLRH